MNLFPKLRWKKHRDPNYIPELDIGIGRRPADEEDFALEIPFPASLKPHGITRVAVIAHIFYADLAGELIGYLGNIPVPADLYISTDTEEKRGLIAKALTDYANGQVEIRVFPNRGRDIAPKWVGYADVYDRYDYFLHIHAKKSLFNPELAGWRRHLHFNLVGSRQIVASNLYLLERDEIGVVFPQHHAITRRAVNWGHSFRPTRAFLQRVGIHIEPSFLSEFPAGSMFWGKSAAFRRLLDLQLKWDDFEEEAGQLDGTLAHVLEHSFLHLVEAQGYRWAKVAANETYPHKATLLPVQSEADVASNLQKIYRPLFLEYASVPPDLNRLDVREVTAIAHQIVKPPGDLVDKEVVLLSTYHPTGFKSRQVLHLIKAFKSAGFEVLLVSAVDSLDDVVPNAIPEIVDGGVLRLNHGHTFSAWAHALKLFPQLYQARTLFFADDSFFGPLNLQAFADVMKRLRRSEADLIALTDSRKISYHYQSNFFAVQNRGSTFSVTKSFWDQVRSIPDRATVFSQYELAFQKVAHAAGVRGEVLFPVAKLKGRTFQGDPTFSLWKKLIKQGFPFIKVELIRDHPMEAKGWEKILRQEGYDLTMIDEHLAMQRT